MWLIGEKKVGLGIEGWRNQKLHNSKLIFRFKGACNVCTIRSGGVLEKVALSHTNWLGLRKSRTIQHHNIAAGFCDRSYF